MKLIGSQFITIEGIEGVGKSTNIQFLEQQLSQANIDYIVTREPGGTQVAEQLRAILLTQSDEKIYKETELFLINAARMQHWKHVIEPNLQAGKWVLCDRFVDATVAYQGGGRGIAPSAIWQLHELFFAGLMPNLTILLDADPEQALARIQARDLDRIEDEPKEFFARIRNQYLQLQRQFPQRIKLVDANLTVPEVQNQLSSIIETFIQENAT